MKRSADRILTTHVGSIVRPKALLDLAGSKVGPPKDPAHYGVLLRAAVAEVVQKQAHAGIDIVNDGEYGKSSWVWQKVKLPPGATNELWGRND